MLDIAQVIERMLATMHVTAQSKLHKEEMHSYDSILKSRWHKTFILKFSNVITVIFTII